MTAPITHTIADLDDLIWIRKDGTEAPITIRLARPYQRATGEWACPIELQGIEHPMQRDVFGESSLQALCLALSLARARLAHLIGRGERIVFANDRGNPISAAFLDALFGVGK